jgi:hypothetical protein
MTFIEGNKKYYICGIPGRYAIKATGNNRIILRCDTLEEAREWLTA